MCSPVQMCRPPLHQYKMWLRWMIVTSFMCWWPRLGYTTPKQTRCAPGMALIAAGWFQQGSNQGALDEAPLRRVWLDAYCIDRSEVKMGQYKRCVKSGRCRAPNTTKNYSARRPAVGMRWRDARAFCRSIGKDLPTEAQWEKAARGQRKQRTYPIRGALSCRKANYGSLGTQACNKKNPRHPQPGKRYPAGPHGIYDLAGNVAEWVADCYDPFFYRRRSTKNPAYLSCSARQGRVIRGGSFASRPWELRVSARKAAWPGGTFSDVGFRCASPAHKHKP